MQSGINFAKEFRPHFLSRILSFRNLNKIAKCIFTYSPWSFCFLLLCLWKIIKLTLFILVIKKISLHILWFLFTKEKTKIIALIFRSRNQILFFWKFRSQNSWWLLWPSIISFLQTIPNKPSFKSFKGQSLVVVPYEIWI